MKECRTREPSAPNRLLLFPARSLLPAAAPPLPPLPPPSSLLASVLEGLRLGVVVGRLSREELGVPRRWAGWG